VWLLPEQLQIAPFARMLIFGIALLVLLRFVPKVVPAAPLAYAPTDRRLTDAAATNQNLCSAQTISDTASARSSLSAASQLSVRGGEGVGWSAETEAARR
jgi:hypothetical protein